MKKHTPTPDKTPNSAPAVAACVFEIEANGKALKLLPAGAFRARDGRPTNAVHWFIDATLASQVIELNDKVGIDLVIDYEHQTMNAALNGQPAPAAGWFSQLEWREGDGLYATDVRWNKRAQTLIEDKEYRYLSPVFLYAEHTGHVTRLLHVAITNNPALDVLPDLQQQAAAHFNLAALVATPPAQETTDVNREQLIAKLRLSADATDADIEAALTQLQTTNTTLTEQLAAATNQPGGNAIDLSQYAPIAVVHGLHAQIAALSAQSNTQGVDAVVAEALKDGRLLPAMEGWARDMGNQNMAALTEYLGKVQPIAALTQTQTGGKPPAKDVKDDASELPAEALAMCKAMGLDPVEYLATLKGEQ
ncbi:MAG TPA: phage protease [Pseudomonas sp.]|uniref:phage protease n=1 Tax=Pseudomonas sp. TaxID=306 RepID=UPI002C997D52|nr:phage protease [Pseudomonas sp.]HWH86348.1 phage protease [Pseudomonas sp.]